MDPSLTSQVKLKNSMYKHEVIKMMWDMHGMGLGIFYLLAVLFLILGILAFAKYLLKG